MELKDLKVGVVIKGDGTGPEDISNPLSITYTVVEKVGFTFKVKAADNGKIYNLPPDDAVHFTNQSHDTRKKIELWRGMKE
jgi:hypothetical protein